MIEDVVLYFGGLPRGGVSGGFKLLAEIVQGKDAAFNLWLEKRSNKTKTMELQDVIDVSLQRKKWNKISKNRTSNM